MIRIGHGFDVHTLVTGRKCIIGGVEIVHEKGLDGHSDADVLLHAVCDALLGAAALGDIGKHFPPSDDTYKNANIENGKVFFRGDKTKKLIALTFDDGPDRKNTPHILDILKKYNVKATFFVIGKQVIKFPDAAKRIVVEGHDV